jgi:hypothetical protein
MTNIYSQLTEPFPQEMERSLNKGGANLAYIPVSEVINRMNKILGVENWSFTVKNWQQLGNSIVAHVSVVATISGNTVTRDGVGGQKIKMTKQGEPVDIGDEVKGAVSDALKKAVQTMGVGLYLARSQDAIEIEQVMEAEIVTASEPPSPSKMTWESFMSVSKGLSKDQKEQLRSAWTQWSDGKPTPTKDTVTEEQANFLLTEATRLTFGGTIIETPAK